jgi:hypothetical protein
LLPSQPVLAPAIGLGASVGEISSAGSPLGRARHTAKGRKRAQTRAVGDGTLRIPSWHQRHRAGFARIGGIAGGCFAA